MASSISAGTTSSTALVATADTTGALQLATNNGTVAVTVDTSQRVGIGTTSPGANLEVKGASGQNIYVSYTSGSQLRLKSDSGDSGVGTTGSTPLVFLINNGEVSRFDTSGNLGIGTSALSGYKLCVGNTSSVTTLNGVGLTLFSNVTLTSNVGGVLNFRPGLGQTVSDIYNLSICAYDHSGDTNADGLSINGSDGISFCTGGNSRNERMRIASDGRVFINTTSSNNNEKVRIKNGDDTRAIAFQSGSSAECGYIYINAGGTSTTYSTSSDYRLKDNIAPMTGALAKVAQLKPVTYTWKINGFQGQGFIAHELQEIVPDAVQGEKDAVNENGDPAYQGIDTSYLVATLTAAIQELTAKVTALEAKVGASA